MESNVYSFLNISMADWKREEYGERYERTAPRLVIVLSRLSYVIVHRNKWA